MKTIIIIDLSLGGLILFLRYGPAVLLWIAVWPARRRCKKARKAADQAELDLAITLANLEAMKRHLRR